MFLKEIFYMPKTDRRVMMLLCAVVLLCVIFYGALQTTDDMSNPIDEQKHQTAQTKGRGYKSVSREKKSTEEYAVRVEPKLFYFDPNTADSTQLLQLGLQPWQVRNIYKYRARGGVYQCKEDFAFVYGLTVKDYRRLEPYIRISADYLPASSLAEVQQKRHSVYGSRRRNEDTSNAVDAETGEKKAYTPKIRVGEYIEANSADTTELMKIPGIGSYYARQIVRYRNQLGGYVSREQLLEIDENFPEEAMKYVKIDDNNVQKLRINQLTIAQLKRHPYINYYQARAISDYRRLHGRIQSMSELKLMKEFSSSDIERISPYVEY